MKNVCDFFSSIPLDESANMPAPSEYKLITRDVRQALRGHRGEGR